jgi:mRNA-degrading endonuclease RelE of RelBE toxin-antitoxin system
MVIKLSQQVARFVRGLAPEPRRKMRLALKSLAKGRGDMRALEGPLSSYWRLRAGSYRVIFSYAGPNQIECVFAERRSIVYEIFAETLRETLVRRGEIPG